MKNYPKEMLATKNYLPKDDSNISPPTPKLSETVYDTTEPYHEYATLTIDSRHPSFKIVEEITGGWQRKLCARSTLVSCGLQRCVER